MNYENSREELNRDHVEYTKWLGLQESLLKQKTQTKWFQKGDYNTKYFHCVLREKRRRLQLHRIKNSKGRWVEGDEKIAKTVINHFKKLSNLPQPVIKHNVLICIPRCLTDFDNVILSSIPDETEIKNVVFSLSVDSRVGPNDFNETFFQH